MAPERYGYNFKYIVIKLISEINIFSISIDIANRWMQYDITDDNTT